MAVHSMWNLLFLMFFLQGPVVEKPVNANLGLKVNRGFCFSCSKAFPVLIFCYSLKEGKVEL